MSSKPKSGSNEPVSRYEATAMGRLKSYGLRLTKPRIQVIERLAKTENPVTANDIYEGIVADGRRIDLVSVYRILNALHELGLVHHIGLVNAYMPCQLEGEHSHSSKHFVCESCEKIIELPSDDNIDSQIKEELAGDGYEVDTVKIEILGKCQSCNK